MAATVQPPSGPTSAPPPVAANSNGYNRPGMVAAGAGSAAVVGAAAAGQSQAQQQPPANAVAQAQQRSQSLDSLRAYQAERGRATSPPQPVAAQQVRQDPVFTSSRQAYGGDPARYVEQRREHYYNYRDRNPEVFQTTQNMRSNYGIFDTNFLTGMFLGALGTGLYDRATWMNGQTNQAWYPQYRADLEKQARENADLRRRVDEMDREMARIRSEGNQPAQAVSALPAGVPAALAIAPEAVEADAAAVDSARAKPPASGGFGWVIWLVVALSAAGAAWFFIIRKR